MAKLGTDGPARRSRLLSMARWAGPPPIPRRGPPRTTNRVTRPPRRSPPQEAARGFWITAWSQREPALRGTGRSNRPGKMAGVAPRAAWTVPATHANATQFASNTQSGRLCTAHWSLICQVGIFVFHPIAISLNNDCLPVMHQPVEHQARQQTAHATHGFSGFSASPAGAVR